MNPKEEAEFLVNIYFKLNMLISSIAEAKQCAIITVKKIINSHDTKEIGIDREIFKHYAQVINEIEKL